MKRFLAVLLVCCLGLSLGGCTKGAGELQFYVIPAGSFNPNQTDSELLATAKEKGRIAFTDEDLAGVVWKEQRFELKELNVLGGYRDGGSAIFQANPEDAFVIALGGRVVYAGGFAPKNGTVAHRNPYIKDESATVFTFCFEEKYGTADSRWNDTLYQYLADRQLLVSGIFEPEEDE